MNVRIEQSEDEAGNSINHIISNHQEICVRYWHEDRIVIFKTFSEICIILNREEVSKLTEVLLDFERKEGNYFKLSQKEAFKNELDGFLFELVSSINNPDKEAYFQAMKIKEEFEKKWSPK